MLAFLSFLTKFDYILSTDGDKKGDNIEKLRKTKHRNCLSNDEIKAIRIAQDGDNAVKRFTETCKRGAFRSLINYNIALKLFIGILLVKIFNIFLATIFFPSLSYATELLDLTDNQKKEVMASYKDELSSTCFNQFASRFVKDNRVMSEQEKTFGKQFCSCITEKITNVSLDGDINRVKQKIQSFAADNNAMGPIVDECISQSR